MLLLYIWLIEDLFVMDQYFVEFQQLVDLGKHMNLTGNELLEFVRAKPALAWDEIIRIREEKREMKRRLPKKQRGIGNIIRKRTRTLLQKQRILCNLSRKRKRGLGNIRRKIKR